MSLQTRKPTGEVAFPFVIVEGESKSGRTYSALRLSADDRVGQTFVFELAENRADEYASLGDFLIVEHDGTFSSLRSQLKAAMAEPSVDGKPNVIVIDTGSALWGMFKDKADARARQSKRAQKILAEDPDADIETTMTYWTAVKEEWWRWFINPLKAWPGIVVLIAKAEEKTKVDGNGQPTKQTEWSRELEKGTVFGATAVVRTRHPKPPIVTDVNSLRVDMPSSGVLDLPASDSLGYFVFDVLGAGGGFVAERVNEVDGAALPVGYAKQKLLTLVEQVIFETEGVQLDDLTPKVVAGRVWEAATWPDDKREWSAADMDECRRIAVDLVADMVPEAVAS